jgi:hypothetical protein
VHEARLYKVGEMSASGASSSSSADSSGSSSGSSSSSDDSDSRGFSAAKIATVKTLCLVAYYMSTKEEFKRIAKKSRLSAPRLKRWCFGRGDVRVDDLPKFKRHLEAWVERELPKKGLPSEEQDVIRGRLEASRALTTLEA